MTCNPDYVYTPPQAIGKWVEVDAGLLCAIDEHYRVYKIGPYASAKK